MQMAADKFVAQQAGMAIRGLQEALGMNNFKKSGTRDTVWV